MRQIPGVIGLSLLLGLTSFSAIAASPAAVEFSAQTYQSTPQQGERKGRIFVGKARVRTELQSNGQTVVRLVDSDTGNSWLIDPQRKVYQTHQVKTEQSNIADRNNPCYRLPNAQCTQMGKESVEGQPAIKWHVKFETAKPSDVSTYWVDTQRGILLRQATPKSVVMEQKLVAQEQLEGRTVEKWHMTVFQKGQKSQVSTRWFDLQLHLAIREEYPGGYVRAMTNIKVGPQQAALFKVPKGYQLIETGQTLPQKSQ